MSVSNSNVGFGVSRQPVRFFSEEIVACHIESDLRKSARGEQVETGTGLSASLSSLSPYLIGVSQVKEKWGGQCLRKIVLEGFLHNRQMSPVYRKFHMESSLYFLKKTW